MSFWGIYTRAEHLRMWILRDDWLHDIPRYYMIILWYFWANMKVLSEHSDWGLGTKSLHSDPVDKPLLGLHIVSNVSK